MKYLVIIVSLIAIFGDTSNAQTFPVLPELESTALLHVDRLLSGENSLSEMAELVNLDSDERFSLAATEFLARLLSESRPAQVEKQLRELLNLSNKRSAARARSVRTWLRLWMYKCVEREWNRANQIGVLQPATRTNPDAGIDALVSGIPTTLNAQPSFRYGDHSPPDVKALRFAAVYLALTRSASDDQERYEEYLFTYRLGHLVPNNSPLAQVLIGSFQTPGLLDGRGTTEFRQVHEFEGEQNSDVNAALLNTRRDLLKSIIEQVSWNKHIEGVIADILVKINQHDDFIRRLQSDVATLQEFERRASVTLDTLPQLLDAIKRGDLRYAHILRIPGAARPDYDALLADAGYRQSLLRAFAPIYRFNVDAIAPTEGLGLPVDPTEYFKRCVDTNNLAEVGGRNEFWKPSLHEATRRDAGFFGRVWRPSFTNQDGRVVVSVQYYLLLTFNGRGAENEVDKAAFDYTISRDAGWHHADWICLDFGVDVTVPNMPVLVHAIYHNHDRALFMYPRALRFEAGRPVAYLEQGSNEPWPNSGTGDEGWPAEGGFAVTYRYYGEVAGIKAYDENEICGPHYGLGAYYDPYANASRVRDLEDATDEDCNFILSFDKPYGSYAAAGAVTGSVLGLVDFRRTIPIDATVPEGPIRQQKMWSRQILSKTGMPLPFAAGTDPFHPQLVDPATGKSLVVTAPCEGGAILHQSTFVP